MNDSPNTGPIAHLVILGSPLALAVVELFHAGGHHGAVFARLAPEIDRWLTVHLIQLVLFPLAALSLYLMLEGRNGLAARASRILLGVFAVGYVAFDAIAGLAIGVLVRNALELPAEAQQIAAQEIQRLFNDPIVGGGGGAPILAVTSTLAWTLAAWLAAFAFRRSGASWGPVVLLVIAGFALLKGHSPPRGPVTFGCLFLAALWLRFDRQWGARTDD